MIDRRITRAPAAPLSAAIALLTAACGNEATGPGRRLTVSVAVTELVGPLVREAAAGQPELECEVYLHALAEGEGRATWLDATLLFYAGPDRQTPVDSSLIPQSEIQQSWGYRDIGAGDTLESGWRFTAPIPFAASLVYRYQQEGRDARSTRVAFDCGPPIPSTPRAPTIGGLTIEPSGGEIEPGDTLRVRYVAESDVGLWTSAVRLSGACSLEKAFAERFVRSSERLVTFVLPMACIPGRSLSLSIEAFDVALQGVTAKGLQPYTVVDHTPPRVYADYAPSASAYVFAGDTLRPFVVAMDNHSVRSIVWDIQPTGVRDSLLGSGGGFIAIPVMPEWAGSRVFMRFFARDATGLVSDTLVLPLGGLPIYPTLARPTRWTTISGDIRDLAVDEGRGSLYLMQGDGGARIGVLSLTSLTITETIPLAVLAWDLDLSVGGDSLVLALPYRRALGIVDLRQAVRTLTELPIQSLDTAAQQAPWGVRVGANGKAYVMLSGPSSSLAGILEVDLVTKTERLLTGNGNVWGASYERSGDRSVLIFARGTELLQRYDVGMDVFGPIRTSPSIYGPLRVDDDGDRVTFGLNVFDGDLMFLGRVASVYGGGALPGAALSKDGEYLFQALGFRGVARTRTSDGAVVDRTPTPFSASGYLRLSPDGNTLILVDSFAGSARIGLIDLR